MQAYSSYSSTYRAPAPVYGTSDPPIGSKVPGGTIQNIEYRVISGGGSYSPGAAVTSSAVTASHPVTSSHGAVPIRSASEYPVDSVAPGQFSHIPTGDGFTSPYETLPQNLNRNPYFKSYYDVPIELRTTEKPPPDFVISQHDPDYQYLQRQGGAQQDYAPQARAAGITRCRFRINAQRQEELKDHGPAVQLADFQVYDLQHNPYPMREFYAECTTGGFCEQGCEVDKVIDGEPGTKFMRREFHNFPVDLEIDFGEPILIGSYSWRTANDTASRDPISWTLQCLSQGHWITMDDVNEILVPKARYAMVGPFGLGELMAEPSPRPSLQEQQYFNDMQPVDRQPQHAEYQYHTDAYPGQHYAGHQEAMPYEESEAEFHDGPVQQVIVINPQATAILHDILGSAHVDRLPARVAELLRKGADPHSPDPKGVTPIIKACRKGDVQVLEMLVDYGANINSKTHTGETGLHRLALHGDARCLEVALRAGGDPNMPDGQGDTPLALAISRADPACVHLLLRAGGRSDLKNHRNQTGLDILEEETRRAGYERPTTREVRQLLRFGAGPSQQYLHRPY